MAERDLGFEETELRLGLPDSSAASSNKSSGKRGFAETIDLKLKLQTSTAADEEEHQEVVKAAPAAVAAVEILPAGKMKKSSSQSCLNVIAASDAVAAAADPEKPRAPKAQVVGWPPVRSFRKNILTVKADKDGKDGGEKSAAAAAFVKVSMDGAPYLRKVDLSMYKGYKELSKALEIMFSSFTFTTAGNSGSNDNGSDYVPTYEDKDGDWMLVGDVPWHMFVESCKRLRLMKGCSSEMYHGTCLLNLANAFD